MSDLKEFLFGYRQVEIESKKTPAEAAKVLKTLNRPHKAFQWVDTMADINQASEPYQIEILKQRHLQFIRLPSVVFSGVVEANPKGKAVLRGQSKFASWYYGGIGLALFLTFIWAAMNPAYGIWGLVFLIFMFFLINRFARLDKDNLLREIGYAA